MEDDSTDLDFTAEKINYIFFNLRETNMCQLSCHKNIVKIRCFNFGLRGIFQGQTQPKKTGQILLN